MYMSHETVTPRAILPELSDVSQANTFTRTPEPVDVGSPLYNGPTSSNFHRTNRAPEYDLGSDPRCRRESTTDLPPRMADGQPEVRSPSIAGDFNHNRRRSHPRYEQCDSDAEQARTTGPTSRTSRALTERSMSTDLKRKRRTSSSARSCAGQSLNVTDNAASAMESEPGGTSEKLSHSEVEQIRRREVGSWKHVIESHLRQCFGWRGRKAPGQGCSSGIYHSEKENFELWAAFIHADSMLWERLLDTEQMKRIGPCFWNPNPIYDAGSSKDGEPSSFYRFLLECAHERGDMEAVRLLKTGTDQWKNKLKCFHREHFVIEAQEPANPETEEQEDRKARKLRQPKAEVRKGRSRK